MAVNYKPEVWNNYPQVKQNNCYNYALNRMDDDYKQPGKDSGYDGHWDDIDELFNLCLEDGLIEDDDSKALLGWEGYHRVCLVVASNDILNFHWYRQDEDGTWSQKMGSLDATGGVIDPIDNARDHWGLDILVGYFWAKD